MKDNERSADPLDNANAAADLFLDANLKNRQATSLEVPEKHPNFDGLHCVEEDCGIEIPAERLAHGRVRCVDCQTRKESRGKLFGRSL
jgi:RNA polymerase-binding transcription factor DksA